MKPRIGQWVCTFAQVVALHGAHEVVLRIGSVEVTLPKAEVWNPEEDSKRSPEHAQLGV